MDAKGHPTTVEEYIARYPEHIQEILHKIRAIVLDEAPEAVEKISYNMPGYFLGDALVWFGAWQEHIALYPVTAAMRETLGEELSGYKQTKGSVHFPLDKPMPYELIRKIVNVRIAEVAAEDKAYA